jgi:serine/threonine protein kinase
MEFGEGKIAGKYIAGPKIGSGSFGEVYLVNLFGTEEVYALKKVLGILIRKMKNRNSCNSRQRQRY